MDKKKIGVIFGGQSPEYSVSLESAYSVIKNINKEKYDVILIGITKKGNWFKYEGDIENIINDTWYKNGVCKKVIISTNTCDKGIINRIIFKLRVIIANIIYNMNKESK